MPMPRPCAVLGLLSALIAAAPSASAAQASAPDDDVVSVASLLRDLTDRSRLPLPRAWSVRLDSSYDRSGGNRDQQQFLAVDGDTALLADLPGPGALVRIWTTSVMKVGTQLSSDQPGVLKIRLDDQAEPVVDLPCGALFKGGRAPFVPPLTTLNGCASYSYLPIPYAKRCRITIEHPAPEFFYQITSLRLPAGTAVRPFAVSLAAEDAAALASASAVWSGAAGAVATAPRTTLTIPAGGTAAIPALTGPGTIDALTIAAPTVDDAGLRRLVLRAWFDGHRTADVEAPVADLFGSAFGRKVFTSLFLAQDAAGDMTCRLPMPFASGARIAIENGNAGPVTLAVALAVRPGAIPAGSLYLHADFHQESTRSGIAHAWLRASGQHGHLVGVVQAMQSGRTLGFCEGDDQIRVDGEAFIPSSAFPTVIAPWNGTGTEDFFNSAWYYAEGIKALPLSACLVKQHFGRIATFRFLVDDAPVFQQSIDAQLEHGGTNQGDGDYYASVAFWYGSGERVPLAAMPAAAELGLPTVAYQDAPIAIEGESLVERASASAGTVASQAMKGLQHVWSGDRELRWDGAGPGAILTLAFAAPAAGRYRIGLLMERGPDCGAVAFAVNGTALPERIDGYGAERQNPGLSDLGSVTLPAGESHLVVTIAGRHGAATASGFGLDLLALRPDVRR
jgi:hypothetical protein